MRRSPAGPWRVLTLALLAQVGTSVIDQGIPTLTGFIKADLRLSAATAGLGLVVLVREDLRLLRRRRGRRPPRRA